jgi:hydroxymethylglutaryl-CoA lyase
VNATSAGPIRIVEVAPRDGLQNEATSLSPAQKAEFINRLAAAGHTTIEAGAFVSARWVPQMADTSDVFRSITRKPGVTYTALVPNLEGLERAIEAGAQGIAIFAAASETFSQRNINQTIAGSLATYRQVCDAAARSRLPVRAYLSTAFVCPFEGTIAPERVVALTGELLALGVYEVSVSDTIGAAHPAQVARLLEVLANAVALPRVAMHFHDTRGTALVNALVALQHGVTTFDASAGGLGGCPYAPGASGNLATEDLVYMLDGLGHRTGITLDGIIEASRWIEPLIGHPLPSRVFRAAQAKQG